MYEWNSGSGLPEHPMSPLSSLSATVVSLRLDLACAAGLLAIVVWRGQTLLAARRATADLPKNTLTLLFGVLATGIFLTEGAMSALGARGAESGAILLSRLTLLTAMVCAALAILVRSGYHALLAAQ